VDTWQDGVIQKQGAGSSDYASRSEVAFKDGKKQGEERLLGKDGKLAATITWDRGVKEGKEISFAEGGKKVVKEIVWKAGEMTQVTELYLNGNPSRGLRRRQADPGQALGQGRQAPVRRRIRGRRLAKAQTVESPLGDEILDRVAGNLGGLGVPSGL
jgi:hypothetical protein